MLYPGESDSGQAPHDNGAFWTNHATGDRTCRDLLRRELTDKEREAVARARRRLDPGPLVEVEESIQATSAKET